MAKAKNIKELATPHPLKKEVKGVIAKELNALLADAFALYLKTKNYHWHVFGKSFYSYHLLFDEQAAQILEMLDILAERVRKIGEVTIHSVGEVNRLKRIKDDERASVKPEEMIKTLLEDNSYFAVQLKKAHELTSKHSDVATTSLLETFIDEAERRVWFLFEHSV